MFGASALAPAGGNDPYANIDIDLSKVKKAEKPSKPFEQRTEEEKVKDQEAKNALNQKTILKTNSQNADDKSKKEVRFGKSTIYQVESTGDSVEDDQNFNNEGTK